MALEDKNKKENEGKSRLTICSRLNQTRSPVCQHDSSRCSSDPAAASLGFREFAIGCVLKTDFIEARRGLFKPRHLQSIFLIANQELEFYITYIK
jgi:hypothetical protein